VTIHLFETERHSNTDICSRHHHPGESPTCGSDIVQSASSVSGSFYVREKEKHLEILRL